MIFKVSKKFQGSCVLPTLKKAIWANITISISGNDLRANDIKDAIRKGILIPIDEDYDVEKMQKDHEVIIINNTDRALVIGKTILRPKGSLPISKEEANAHEITSAREDGFVTILSDEEEPYIKRKIEIKKKRTKKESVEEADYVTPESGEDKEPTAVVWNFKKKEAEKAEKVTKCEDVVSIDEEVENVDFIGKEDELKPQKIEAKKKTTKKKTTKKKVKKTTKKKVVSNKKTKKKEIKRKSKKVKELKPVGDKRIPKTVADAAIELDSRGNPIGNKPGDTLQHLIDSLNAPGDVYFVDQEQEQDRYEKRTDVNSPPQ